MRRRDVLKLFVTEYETDPATGKEKRVTRYIGPWYTMDAKPRRSCGIVCGIAWLLAAAAFVTAGVIPSWAGLCGYVVPWYILCLLPLFYLLLGFVKLLRLKENFTEVDKSESLGYVQTSGLALAALGGAWSIATVIFLLLNDRSMTLPQELIFMGCGVVTAAVGGAVLLAARKAAGEIRNSECEMRN